MVGSLIGLVVLWLVAGAGFARAEITYARDISRIVQAKCQQCHRPNDIAPFPLMSYEDLAQRAEAIQHVIAERIMPPWKPVPGFGEFRDSYALSEEERQMILNWIADGLPEGDPADLPEPIVTTGQWQLGEPDLVLQMQQPYAPPPVRDLYRCFVIPTGLAEDKYLSALEVLPGNRQIVHHVLLFVDTTGEAEKLAAQEDGQSYTCFGGPRFPLQINGVLGAWVPGTRVRPLANGIAVQLRGGARLVMQVHYHLAGNLGPDQTRVGLYYTRAPVERRLFYIPIVNTQFQIPPGEQKYEVTARFTVPLFLDAKAVVVVPHMHLLGRQIKLEVETPDRQRKPLIFIDDWDFNWQGFYTFAEPVSLPAFSTVRLTCIFDNSTNNPRNPNNPPKPVGWGEGTEDEMCLAGVGVTFDRENLLPFRLGSRR